MAENVKTPQPNFGQEMLSYDIKSAVSIELRKLFVGMDGKPITVYTENLPTKDVKFPNFHILGLQTTRQEDSRLHGRDRFDVWDYFMTVKYRTERGRKNPENMLFADFDEVGFALLRDFTHVRLGNARHRLLNTYTETEPESDMGLMVLGFYFNVEVPVVVPRLRNPLQERLHYKTQTKQGNERHAFTQNPMIIASLTNQHSTRISNYSNQEPCS
ncbi:MAG: hypothetical protein FWG65_13215 [Turicibacter sp.]|nr:hypothetical protein [Turicibacter sp.]